MKRVARIDFEYGGIKFKAGEPVPEPFAQHLESFGGMYLATATVKTINPYPKVSTGQGEQNG